MILSFGFDTTRARKKEQCLGKGAGVRAGEGAGARAGAGFKLMKYQIISSIETMVDD